jgi:type I restriction enzyme S subunit
MKWPTVKLGDVMTVGRGSSPRPIKDERFFTGGTIPWVKIADATASGKFIYQTNQHVNDYGASFSRKLKPGALIFPASGTLGIPRFLGVEACIHDGWLYFSDYQGINPDWLYYRIILLKEYYEGIAYGAAIQNINTDIVRSTEIQLPDLATQHAMSAVLGAYDDLIAINQRRIALLEDAARRLYREWFVHLRFPGYESVPVKDGVPEGWAIMPLGDVAPLYYGKALKATDRKEGEVPVYGSSGIVGTHSAALVESGAIVVGRKGNVGSLFFSRAPCFPIDTVFYISPSQASYWLFLALHQLNFISSDAAVPGLNRTYAHSLPVLQPNNDIAAAFERMVQPVFEQSQHLTDHNAQLAQARDLLLPKLMSGQLDVSGIRLPEELAV